MDSYQQAPEQTNAITAATTHEVRARALHEERAELAMQSLALNIAARVVAGGGDMTLVAFREDGQPEIRVAAHGLNAHGELVISCFEEDLAHRNSYEVRMDVRLGAPVIDATVSTASVHALGVVDWIGGCGPWVTGVLHLGHLLVHHLGEPQKVPVPAVWGLAESLCEADADQLGAFNIVTQLGDATLNSLMDAALLGVVTGVPGHPRRLQSCPSLHNRIFLADICSQGITLLRTTKTMQTNVFIPYTQPVATLTDLADALDALERAAVPA